MRYFLIRLSRWTFPQGLKPVDMVGFSARLKSCPFKPATLRCLRA
jgi:hypothetical protein